MRGGPRLPTAASRGIRSASLYLGGSRLEALGVAEGAWVGTFYARAKLRPGDIVALTPGTQR